MFRGLNASAPLINGVKAIRLTGINDTAAFQIGTMTALSYQIITTTLERESHENPSSPFGKK
jgi:hypothetical protein